MQHKKPDPTKGTVTGIVLCADTGKPARFATVTLTAAPKKDAKTDADKDENSGPGDPLPATEATVTDLDGRFRLEAVEPGRYYAFATLEGYLEPKMGIDPTRFGEKASLQERIRNAIDQWKSHLVEVRVSVHSTSEVALQIERAAEITGSVTYDDGSPAIGIFIQIFHKTEKGSLAKVGLSLNSDWDRAVSDSHGHFSVTNLAAGEYTICAKLPYESEDSSFRVFLGNTFRRKNAKTVKVQAGEVSGGADIEIPLSGLHTVAGTVSALADSHALKDAAVRLLYADDREIVREAKALDDGSFSFSYVPEDKYILQVSGAQDPEQKASETDSDNSDSAASKPVPARRYADRETPVTVIGDMDDIQMQLVPVPPEKPPAQ
ncbi:MAG: carboxypeptidase-like regulatory domain-containing protein [Terracidiphilus sp.]